MPPSRRHSSAPSTNGFPGETGRGHTKYNVWYYMNNATSSTRPSDELLEAALISDEQRQAAFSIVFPHDRPLGARIRCIICLKTRNEWKTWRNRAGPILNKLRDHLEAEHAITFDGNGMSRRPAEPGSPGSSSELSALPQEAQELPASTAISLPMVQNQLAAVAPHEPPAKPPNVSQQAPLQPLPAPSQPQQALSQPQQALSQPQPTSSHPQQNPAPESLAVALAKTAVRVASGSQPLVPGFRTIENARVQLEQVKAERDQLKVERDQLKVERDHEVELRRKLQAEIEQLRAASRDREEELINVSRLMCASIQALARNSAVHGAVAEPSGSNLV